MRGDHSIAVIGANLSLGQTLPGTKKTYAWLKQEGLLPQLEEMFSFVQDQGGLEQEEMIFENIPNAHHLVNVMAFNKKLADKVKECHKNFDLTLQIGGDHSAAMGSISGSLSYHREIKVIWVDAHADFNTPETSPSGNLHGMPLSFLTRYISSDFEKYLDWMHPLNPKNLVMIGLRDLDSKEPEILKELGVCYFTMEKIHHDGLESVLEQTLQHLDPLKNAFFHLSFDVDGIDAHCLPSTGTPVPNGLKVDEGALIVQKLFQTGRLKAFDLVEINPDIGDEKALSKTKTAVFEILKGLDAH